MKVLNDYKCPQGHTHEHFVENSVKDIQCLECPSLATKVIAPIRSILDHSFPGASLKWEKKREEKMAYEKSQGHTAWDQ